MYVRVHAVTYIIGTYVHTQSSYVHFILHVLIILSQIYVRTYVRIYFTMYSVPVEVAMLNFLFP